MQARLTLESKKQIRNLFKKEEFAHSAVGTIIGKAQWRSHQGTTEME
jgi:hypothetical protein